MIHDGKTVKMILKFQQEYQLDQQARAEIKNKYRGDEQQESEYWANVKLAAYEISSSVDTKGKKLPELTEELSRAVGNLRLQFQHVKKTTAQIKDDVQLTAKTLIIKKLTGNNNVLIIGKFRVLTLEGHYKMIQRALNLYDNVVVDIVTSKDTKNTKDLRERMIRTAFPKVEIVHSVNGNLSRIIQKSPVNINAVYAGSDRVRGYSDQLAHTLGVQVKEMPRLDSDISASEVISKIKDAGFFKKSTPKAIHSMYQEIKEAYTQ